MPGSLRICIYAGRPCVINICVIQILFYVSGEASERSPLNDTLVLMQQLHMRVESDHLPEKTQGECCKIRPFHSFFLFKREI